MSELEVEVVEPDPAPAVFVGVRGALSATALFLLIRLMMFSLWSKVISETKKEKDRWRIFSGGMFVSRQPAECGLADRCVKVCDQGRILRQVGHRSRRTNCPRDPSYGICQ